MDRTVRVTGSATVAVEPDLAQFRCGVRVSGANARDALNRANQQMADMLEAVIAQGVERTDVRSSGPALHTNDDGYVATNDASIVVRDVDVLGSVIDAVVGAGGPDLTMRGVTFAVSEPQAHLSHARAAAMASARSIAEELAAAGGATVGDVVTIVESTYQPTPVAPRAAAKALMASAPVEPGEQHLRVDVEVTYELT